MANYLNMAAIDSILTLYRQGWSQRRIARELQLNRETVARYLRQVYGAKPAIAPAGAPDSAEPPEPAIAPAGEEEGLSTAALNPGTLSDATPDGLDRGPPQRGRPSDCEPWRAIIRAKLAQGLSAQRIYQDLVAEHGFTSKYPSVRRFVHALQAIEELPCRRLECLAGDEAQVDFGTGAWLLSAEGQRRRTHVLRIVLSYSRKGYSEAVLRQTTEAFLQCLENAFHHFGGVPKRLLLDNLKAAVQRADWFDPELQPKFASFCQHYSLVAWPLRPRKPQHKGKVERGIGYVQDNGLKGRCFATLAELNQHLLDWERTVADRRIHGTTRQQVGSHFLACERPALQALPRERFPCFHEGQRTVNRDGHLEVARAYYSVPPEYLYHRLWVRWDGRLVKIFDQQMRPIATHVQREAGRFSTHDAHLADRKISDVERGTRVLLQQVRRVGPHTTRWAESLLAQRGIEAIRVLQGLKSLARRYPCEQLEEACRIAQAHGCYRLRTLRQLLGKQACHEQQTFPFLEEHPLIRPLADYDRFVHDALQQEI